MSETSESWSPARASRLPKDLQMQHKQHKQQQQAKITPVTTIIIKAALLPPLDDGGLLAGAGGAGAEGTGGGAGGGVGVLPFQQQKLLHPESFFLQSKPQHLKAESLRPHPFAKKLLFPGFRVHLASVRNHLEQRARAHTVVNDWCIGAQSKCVL